MCRCHYKTRNKTLWFSNCSVLNWLIFSISSNIQLFMCLSVYLDTVRVKTSDPGETTPSKSLYQSAKSIKEFSNNSKLSYNFLLLTCLPDFRDTFLSGYGYLPGGSQYKLWQTELKRTTRQSWKAQEKIYIGSVLQDIWAGRATQGAAVHRQKEWFPCSCTQPSSPVSKFKGQSG